MLGKKNESRTSKILDVDASMQGSLVFKDAVNLHINGSFDGRLETKGSLVIGEGASVRADIIGENISIAGNVHGDITASAEVALKSTARVYGNIKTPTLSVEKGATFHGLSRMLENEAAELATPRVFFNLEDVAKYLSVERELVTEWAQSGKLPGAREGEGWRFDKRRVDEWIANGRIQ